MKNLLCKLTCPTTDEVVVSLRKTKTRFLVAVRLWTAVDETTRVGLREYFELTEEDKAQSAFDRLVKDASAKGWVVMSRTGRLDDFVAIPVAPTKPVDAKPTELKRVGGRK